MEHVDLVQIAKKESEPSRLYDSESVNIMRVLDSINVGCAAFYLNGFICGSNKTIYNFAKLNEEEIYDELNWENKCDLENKLMSESILTRGISTFSCVQDEVVKVFIENLLNNFFEIKENFQCDLLTRDKKDTNSHLNPLRKQSENTLRRRKRSVEISEFIDCFRHILIGEDFLLVGIAKIKNNNLSSKFFELKARCVIWEHSHILEFLITDVTKLKEAELMRDSMKYKSLGLAKVAHDFKHVIGAIIGTLQEIETHTPDKLSSNESNGSYSNKSDENSNHSNSQHSFHQEDPSESPRRKLERCKTHIPNKHVINKLQMNMGHINKKNIIQNFCNYATVLIQDFSIYANTDIEKYQLKQGNQERLSVKEVEIIPILEFCVNIFKIKQKYDGKEGVSILLELDPELPKYILVNEFKLKQVLVNLISNAYKFTIAGLIRVSAVSVDKVVRISVSDSGIGMSPEELKMLFNPFTKLESGKNYNACGTGLGLMIIKETLQKMGSRIELKSEKGHGSTFWFDIPMELTSLSSNFYARKSESDEYSIIDQNSVYTESLINMILTFNDHNDPLTNRSELSEIQLHPNKHFNHLRNVILEKKEEDTNRDETEISPLPKSTVEGINYVNKVMRKFSSNKVVSKFATAKSYSQKSFKKYHVLICDDDKHIISWAKNMLTDIQYEYKIEFEIQQAEDAISCLNLIYSERKKNKYFDLLIIDESMPFLRGSLLVKLLKSLIEDKEILELFIYIASSYDDPSIFQQFKNSGCSGLLSKPISKDSLIHVLKEIKFI